MIKIYISIALWWVLSTFLASFLFSGEWKVRKHWRDVNGLYSLWLLCHTNHQMHVCLIAPSVKLLTSAAAIFGHVPIQVNQDCFMLTLTWIFLGCDLPIQLLLKLSSSTYYDRFVDRFHNVPITSWTVKYVTSHTWRNRLTHFSTCSLPIQLLLCVKIIVTKHLTTSII